LPKTRTAFQICFSEVSFHNQGSALAIQQNTNLGNVVKDYTGKYNSTIMTVVMVAKIKKQVCPSQDRDVIPATVSPLQEFL